MGIVQGMLAGLALAVSGTGLLGQEELAPRSLSDFDFFGEQLTVHGDRAVVSAPFAEGLADNTGVLYVFRREPVGWVLEATLAPSDGPLNGLVGATLALGDNVLIAGSRANVGTLEQVGSIYVFRRTGKRWVEEARIDAPAPFAFGQFAQGIALGDNEDEIVGGMPGPSHATGAAFVFRREAGVWTLVQTLVPAGSNEDAHFGGAVAMSGDYLAVSATGESGPAPLWATGAVFLYRRAQNGSWVATDELRAPQAAAWDAFGTTLAMDGRSLAVGMPFDDDAGNSSGSVFMFRQRRAGWDLVQKITAPDAQVDDAFGRSLQLLGDRLVVGARNPEQPGLPPHTGSAYLLRLQRGSWEPVVKLLPTGLPTDTDFGLTVGLNRSAVLVGASRDSSAGSMVGQVYAYDVP